MGYGPWGCQVSDTIEQKHQYFARGVYLKGRSADEPLPHTFSKPRFLWCLYASEDFLKINLSAVMFSYNCCCSVAKLCATHCHPMECMGELIF